MSQNSLALSLTGVYSGTTAATDINQALDTLATLNSGSSAPSSPEEGWFWLDISVSNQATLKQYDGSVWCPLWTMDLVNHRISPVVGGGVATLAGAGTTDLGSVYQPSVTISGTATITSLGATAGVGTFKFLTFSGASILTHDATALILPTAANITTAAGDTCLAQCTASGDWRVLAYQRATGASLINSGNINGSFQLSAVLAPSSLGTSQNDFTPTGNATNSIWTLTSSASINITGIAGGTEGRLLCLRNINALGSGFNITLPSQNTNSLAANRIASPCDIVLRPGQQVVLQYDTTASRWIPFNVVQAGGLSGAFKNLKIVTTGVGVQTATLTADELGLSDSDGNTCRVLGVNQTVNVSTSGAGGLDTGSLAASTWYALWVIYNPSAGTVALMASLSATAPTMPSGYTFKARFGYTRTDSSGSKFLLMMQQLGRRANYVITAASNVAVLPVIASGGSITGNTAESVSNFVPPTAASIKVQVVIQSPGASCSATLSPSSAYSATPNSSPYPFWSFEQAASAPAGALIFNTAVEIALESTNIYVGAGAMSLAVFSAYGWDDNI